MAIDQRRSNGRAVRSAEAIERGARAWELRVEHLAYQQIGDELGITKEGARQAVERHAKTIPVEARESSLRHRKQERTLRATAHSAPILLGLGGAASETAAGYLAARR